MDNSILPEFTKKAKELLFGKPKKKKYATKNAPAGNTKAGSYNKAKRKGYEDMLKEANKTRGQ
jgi:hypothetical protein